MKDNINRLARGNFRYELPAIFISEANIQASVPEENVHWGTFRIQGSNETKGIIYSTDLRVTVENNIFSGLENSIRYSVNTTGLLPGDSIDGKFNIVSNAAELSISYHFSVILSQKPTSSGTIEHKEPVNVYLDEYNKIYEHLSENFKDTIIIHKSTSEHIPVQIFVDCEFIKLINYSTHQEIDSFTGNKFALEYLLNRANMHAGKNYGRITIKTDRQEVSCQIEACKENLQDSDNLQENSVARKRKHMLYKLSRSYLEFRTKKITTDEWVKDYQSILDDWQDKKDIYYEAVQTMLFASLKRIEEAEAILKNIEKEIDAYREDIVFYCFYLYISSLIKQDSAYSNQVFQRIKTYYEEKNHSWQLLWMLFYTGEIYNRNQSIKLVKVKEQFHDGCRSPLLYLEAVLIFNSNPVLLRVLDQFEIQVILFASKNNLIQEDFAKQIFYLAKSKKNVSNFFLKTLYNIYNIYKDDKMLTVLCEILIRNAIIGKKVLDIYELCIEKNLKITKLYEYYMESVDESKMKIFPKMLLLYFAYNNQLSMEKKAYLYANIIFNKEKDTSTYNSYRKQIEIFAYEQMKKGSINDNLSVVYKDLFDESLINSQDSTAFYKIYFTYKITVENKNVKYAIVRHKELIFEERILLMKGIAYFQIYTDIPALFFEDEKGNLVWAQYTLTPLFTFHKEIVESLCHVSDSENLFMFLHRSEQILEKKDSISEDLSVQLYLLKSSKVTDDYKKMLRKWLIAYFYEGDEKENFKKYFTDIEIEALSVKEASRLVELCVSNYMVEDAYDIVVLYGWRGIRIEDICILCKKMLKYFDSSYNRIITEISYMLFEEKNCDADILRYLAKHYNGTSDQMYRLYKGCMESGTDCHELQERLISQLLFTHQNQKQLDIVFDEYYNYGAAELVAEAYLGYNSYQYFVNGNEISNLVFQIVESILMGGETTQTVNILALLKHYSRLNDLSEEKKILSEKLIERLCNENRLFTFYHHFASRITLPIHIYNKTIIEYRTNPQYQVTLNYRILNDNNRSSEYRQEVLKNTFMGICTKAFVLLYGDVLEYYFTVTAQGKEASTNIMRLVYDKINTYGARKRFDYLNDILASRALEDQVTMQQIMHDYCVQDYVVTQLFETLV